MKTHVSMNGFLYKLAGLTQSSEGLSFIGYGRHVNPKGHYVDAPTIGLYVDRFGKYWGLKCAK